MSCDLRSLNHSLLIPNYLFLLNRVITDFWHGSTAPAIGGTCYFGAR